VPAHARPHRFVAIVAVLVVFVGGSAVALTAWQHHGTKNALATAPATPPPPYPGMPPVADTTNIYSEIGPTHLSPQHASDPHRVYVPNGLSNTVTVIDEDTRQVLSTFPAGRQPQHIVPSYDLSTLWVLDNSGNQLLPIDAATGQPGKPVPVDDPYNLYFTPDGTSAIVVAEAKARLDFRDPHTMALTSSLSVPSCRGINHADYSADGSYMLVTCEFAGKLAKIDVAQRKVVGMLDLVADGVPTQPKVAPMRMPDGGEAAAMPQDVRAGPDGRHFYVADMLLGGVYVVDGDSFTVTGFIPTGVGAHGITPSRDGSLLYIANRGSDRIEGPPHGPGSVSVLDPATNMVTATWPVPQGGSPDMGNLNIDGTELWLSGRFDSEVYVFDTVHGVLAARIPVGDGPHGLTVWPQPGRFSLGHTGNMR
jgi:YVTN family beta-propeller protein